MSTSRGAAVRPSTAGSAVRIKRAALTAVGLLVVIGASAVGLHDVAESQLASPSASVEG